MNNKKNARLFFHFSRRRRMEATMSVLQQHDEEEI